MTPEEADRLHDEGLMPDWAWFSQNGRSTQYNIDYQMRKIHAETDKMLNERFKAKKKAELKKELQDKITEAIEEGIAEGTSQVAEQAADDIVARLEEAFNNKTPFNGGKKTFAADIGAAVGRALGDAPFKALDDLMNEY